MPKHVSEPVEKTGTDKDTMVDDNTSEDAGRNDSNNGNNASPVENFMDEADSLRSSDDYDDDYENESVFITLPEGKTGLKFLNDGVKTTVNFGSQDRPDLQDKVMFQVEPVDGHVLVPDGDGGKTEVLPDELDEDTEYLYSVTEAETEASQWGQIVSVGVDRNGLEGEELTFIRTGTGTDTNYTVLEAADIA